MRSSFLPAHRGPPRHPWQDAALPGPVVNRRRRSLLAAVLVISSLAYACSGGDKQSPTDVDPPRVTRVVVSPGSMTFTALGQTAQLRAQVTDQFGSDIGGGALSWSSSDTDVAVVSGWPPVQLPPGMMPLFEITWPR